VVLTLSVSLVEALIILPSHIAHSKALTKGQKAYWINRQADRFISWLRDTLYAPYLKFFIKNKFLGLAIPIMFLIITLGAMAGGIIRVTFFPTIASDRVSITLRMPQGTNELLTDSLATEIEKAAWAVNEDYKGKQSGDLNIVENIIKRLGPGTANASITVNLLPGEKRDFPAYEISTAIFDKVGVLHGVETLEFGSGSGFGGKPVSVSLMGNNIQELKGAKEILKERLRDNPLLKDVADNDPAGIKEIEILLKENAYGMGFTLSDVISQVRSGFFGFQAQRFMRIRDEIRVWVRYDRDARSSIKNLDDMRIVSPSGQRVPLSEIAEYQIARGEISINHLDGRREINVSADLKDPRNSSATDIMDEVKGVIMPEIQALYPTVTAGFEGQNREFARVTNSAATVLPVILFLMFMVIAFTFRSISQPLLLFIMVPFSLIGVAWGHWIHNFPINMLSFLGIIALIGIVVNDGLVLIQKFNGYLKEGLKFDDAILAAGKSRFRAIFLTSITTIAGLSPLMLEKSRQAQFLIPMAISIAYGIGVATVLTLLMLPILLAVGNSMKYYWKWLVSGKKTEREELERAIIEQKVESYDL